jgi:hypothetical protein
MTPPATTNRPANTAAMIHAGNGAFDAAICFDVTSFIFVVVAVVGGAVVVNVTATAVEDDGDVWLALVDVTLTSVQH